MREFMVIPHYPNKWAKRAYPFDNGFASLYTQIIYANNKEDAVRKAIFQEGDHSITRTKHYIVFDMRTATFFESEIPEVAVAAEERPPNASTSGTRSN